MVNKDTKLFISVASSPTNFGATVYNTLFKKYNIDAIYLPRKATTASDLIQSIKTLSISGCSVSMPLKSDIVKYLDNYDDVVKNTNMSNTIINDNGKLIGYNTDVIGITNCIKNLNLSSVLIYGGGAICRSAVYSLKQHGVNDITLTGRDSNKIASTAAELSVNFQNVDREFDLLINVTPSSIDLDCPAIKLLPFVSSVFDVVVSKKDTALINAAKNKYIIRGLDMYCHQVKHQFELYTKISIDINDISNIKFA